MAEYGRIEHLFWADAFDLSAPEKLLALYLLCGPQCNKCGLYTLSIAKLIEETGLPEKDILSLLKTVCDCFEWKHDSKNRVMFVRTYFLYNTILGPKHLKGCLHSLTIKKTPLLEDWGEASKKYIRPHTKPNEKTGESSDMHALFDSLVGEKIASVRGETLTPAPVKPVKTPKPKKEKKDTSGFNESFQSFWDIWPRKKAPKIALKAWVKLCILENDRLFKIIIADVNARKDSDDWTKENRQFCPYPATYLNGRRWEDEATAGPKHGGESLSSHYGKEKPQ